MNEKLRILITNNTLDERAGSELVVLELAKALRKRGHLPVAYSRTVGAVARELHRACIPVISDLSDLGAEPDIIHGQHHLEAMSAMLYFDQCPAIFVCHGWLPWQELPPKYSGIGKYVAVSELTRERVLTTLGINESQVTVLENCIDSSVFRKKPVIADRPRRAVLFNNAVRPQSQYAKLIRAACSKAGIDTVDIVGLASGNRIANPEEVIAQYDLVFAVGRSAIEAMMLGCAVIVADLNGVAGLVTTENMKAWREKNFALAIVEKDRLTEANLLAELARYDARDVSEVSDWITSVAGLDGAADRYIALYRQVIAERRAAEAEGGDKRRAREAAQYLVGLSDHLKTVDNLRKSLHDEKGRNQTLKKRETVLTAELAKKGVRISFD